MFRFFIFFIFIILCCGSNGRMLCAQNQVYDSPLPIPLLLSGNFGELRETHFHTGVDLKTGGVVGVPVISMAEGVVSRVKVSPVGYGSGSNSYPWIHFESYPSPSQTDYSYHRGRT